MIDLPKGISVSAPRALLAPSKMLAYHPEFQLFKGLAEIADPCLPVLANNNWMLFGRGLLFDELQPVLEAAIKMGKASGVQGAWRYDKRNGLKHSKDEGFRSPDFVLALPPSGKYAELNCLQPDVNLGTGKAKVTVDDSAVVVSWDVHMGIVDANGVFDPTTPEELVPRKYLSLCYLMGLLKLNIRIFVSLDSEDDYRLLLISERRCDAVGVLMTCGDG